MLGLRLLLAVVAALCFHCADAVANPGRVLSLDEFKNLVITPLSGRMVFVSGVDVVAGAAAATSLLGKLEARLKITPQPIVPPPEREPIAVICLCPTSRDANRDFAAHAGQCTPAVRFASGSVACCAAEKDISSCRWTASNSSCHSILASAADAANVTNALHGFDTPVRVGHEGKKINEGKEARGGETICIRREGRWKKQQTKAYGRKTSKRGVKLVTVV